MFRLILFFLIAVLSLGSFYWLTIPLVLWYSYLFYGYELIILAILVDGYFGAFYEIPFFSITALCLVFIVNTVKTSLLMYTDKDEMVS